ncbi:hypothetical protein TNCV_3144621 [Trichonephila clavipes]|nr:hypothetical protein TNCV_3144621 [Trichonephila clavipes]
MLLKTTRESYDVITYDWRNNPWPSMLFSVYVTLDAEVHKQMFRSGGQPEVKSSVYSLQASWVLIHRPTEGMKA